MLLETVHYNSHFLSEPSIWTIYATSDLWIELCSNKSWM